MLYFFTVLIMWNALLLPFEFHAERDLALSDLEKTECERQHWKCRYEATVGEVEALKQARMLCLR